MKLYDPNFVPTIPEENKDEEIEIAVEEIVEASDDVRSPEAQFPLQGIGKEVQLVISSVEPPATTAITGVTDQSIEVEPLPAITHLQQAVCLLPP